MDSTWTPGRRIAGTCCGLSHNKAGLDILWVTACALEGRPGTQAIFLPVSWVAKQQPSLGIESSQGYCKQQKMFSDVTDQDINTAYKIPNYHYNESHQIDHSIFFFQKHIKSGFKKSGLLSWEKGPGSDEFGPLWSKEVTAL